MEDFVVKMLLNLVLAAYSFVGKFLVLANKNLVLSLRDDRGSRES